MTQILGLHKLHALGLDIALGLSMDYVIDHSDPPFVCFAWEDDKVLTSEEIWDLNMSYPVFEAKIDNYRCYVDLNTKEQRYYFGETEVTWKQLPSQVKYEFANRYSQILYKNLKKKSKG